MFTDSQQQVAALPWRRVDGDVQVLLITSRETKRWVIPKGWPMKGKTLAGAAAQEAFEEAGVRGRLSEKSVGRFHYRKKRRKAGDLPMHVDVFPLEVQQELAAWPEAGQRQRQWFTRVEATGLVAEDELQMVISSFEPQPRMTWVEKIRLYLFGQTR